MTESEWMQSEDPAAMLEWATRPGRYRSGKEPHLSDRKLRLFACAAFRLLAAYSPGDEELLRKCEVAAEGEGSLPGHAYWCAVADAADAARQGCDIRRHGRDDASKTVPALLREVFGNPFRPVSLPKTPVWHPAMGAGFTCLWLTPTVLSLAAAAYEERPGRECEACKGTGKSSVAVLMSHPPQAPRCHPCGGSGRVMDGTLDSARLAVLSDALEEAGCDSQELLAHLRGDFANAAGERVLGAYRHLPHVRGCWALDLVLGKS